MRKNLPVAIALVISILVFIGGATYVVFDAANSRDALCRNQHSVVEMQRLFLDEHAAIRKQLQDAGIPNRHSDPNLLKELEKLINRADCKIVDKGD